MAHPKHTAPSLFDPREEAVLAVVAVAVPLLARLLLGA